MSELREVGFLITKIYHLSNRIFTQILKTREIQIHPGQGRVLFVLWRKDGISINELTKKTSIGKSTLTGILDGLEKDGYVTRIRSTDDRRKIFVKLTEKSKKLRYKYQKVSEEMTEKFYRGISDEEIDRFEGTLHKILSNLSSQ